MSKTKSIESQVEEFETEFVVQTDAEGEKDWAYLYTKDVIQYPHAEDLIKWLTQALQERDRIAYKRGYNAGLADGTDKPLLAIEHIQEQAKEEERKKSPMKLRAEEKQILFLKGREYERKMKYKKAVANGVRKAGLQLLKKFPPELKPDDGQGEEDSYNAGWNTCRNEIGSICIDAFGGSKKDKLDAL